MFSLEHVREYYRICRPSLEAEIPDIMAVAAVGKVGANSACFGLEWELPQEQDPCFCLWLDDATLELEKTRVEAAFSKLPASFNGRPARISPGKTGPMGIKYFYSYYTGVEHPPQNWRQWLAIGEDRLADACNGVIFEDNGGLFTGWRDQLLAYYPTDVWLHKLVAATRRMGLDGQGILPAALQRRDSGSAMLACAGFCKAALHLVYLFNRHFMPFYEWAVPLCAELPILGAELATLLAQLAAHRLRDGRDMGAAELIEDFCVACSAHLRSQGLSGEESSWLWAHSTSIGSHIRVADLAEY